MFTMRRSWVTFLTATLVLAGMPVAPPAGAQTPAACDAAIESLERETDQLGGQLDREVREYVRGEAAESALRGIRNHYKSRPTSEALFDLKDKWDKWNEYVEYLRNARVTLQHLQDCLNTPGCSPTEFAKRQHQAIAKWIQSFGNDSISAATERVNKAAKLIQDYVDRTLSLVNRGALATVQECNTQFERQVDATTTQVGTPSAGSPPSSAPPQVSKPKGMSTGAQIALYGAAAAGGIAAGLMLYEPLDPVATLPPPSTRPTTTTSTTTTSCTHLGNSGGCSGPQLQIIADAWAQTQSSPKRFNVFSVPRGANPTACQLQTTVCLGNGCSSPGLRSPTAELRGLGNMTDATVTIVPIDGGTPGQRSWNVNLTQCLTRVPYP